MKEAEFQSQVEELCKWLGLLTYHTYNARRSNPGFPDLVIVGPGGVIFAELKNETGKVSPSQAHWMRELDRAGAEAYVWRPGDIGLIANRLKALARGVVFQQEVPR